MAIFRRIFQLTAELSGRFALNHHLHIRRRQRPFRIPRRHVRARKIRGLMARAAFHSVYAFAFGAALHVLNVHVPIITLQRRVARRMAIPATRGIKNSPRAIESSLRGGRVRFLGAAGCSRRSQNRMLGIRRGVERGFLMRESRQARDQNQQEYQHG
jgi:hypothetical protein